MKVSTIIAILGSFVVMVLAFANLGQYLIFGVSPAWTAFLLLMLIAGAVGALPGLMITLMTGKRRDH